MPWWIYRFGAVGAALAAFLGMSWLYAYGNRDLYQHILQAYGIVPFRFPFVDTSGSLAAWECTRRGIDVIISDPCDVLRRGYMYAPLWLAVAGIPLGPPDTPVVGWSLDLLFILSLSLLPPPTRPLELALVLAATLSTMVAFAVERANPDVLLLMLALAAGFLGAGRLPARLVGYGVALLAGLLKYYPIVLLIIVFRERIPVFLAILAAVTGALGVFWAEFHAEIAEGIPHIPRGPYNTDLFSAQNLPFLIGEVAGTAASSRIVERIVSSALYAALAGASVALAWRLSRLRELPAGLAALPRLERLLLVIGSAVMAGCFFAGQSIGYRGIFLLLVLPGLLGLARSSFREQRVVALGTGIVIVLLMWGECLRLGLYRALDETAISKALAGGVKIQFWLTRELCWWWSVGVMLALLVAFLRNSPIMRGACSLVSRRWPVQAR
jgi:hypothetical protein